MAKLVICEATLSHLLGLTVDGGSRIASLRRCNALVTVFCVCTCCCRPVSRSIRTTVLRTPATGDWLVGSNPPLLLPSVVKQEYAKRHKRLGSTELSSIAPGRTPQAKPQMGPVTKRYSRQILLVCRSQIYLSQTEARLKSKLEIGI